MRQNDRDFLLHCAMDAALIFSACMAFVWLRSL